MPWAAKILAGASGKATLAAWHHPTIGAPVFDYARPIAPASDPTNQFRGTVVTGGYLYRGPDPSLHGKYFFLDSRNSSSATDDNYWYFDPSDPVGTVQNIDSLMIPNVGTTQFPVSFGEDAVGNLYIAYISSGNVYRVGTTPVPEPSTLMAAIPCLATARLAEIVAMLGVIDHEASISLRQLSRHTEREDAMKLFKRLFVPLPFFTGFRRW